MTKEDFLAGKPFQYRMHIYRCESGVYGKLIAKRNSTGGYDYYASISKISDTTFEVYAGFFGIVANDIVAYSDITKI